MMRTHTGGCHCGRVRFEVIAPAAIEVDECDCSICSKVGFLHLIVPTERFKLLSGSRCTHDLHLQYTGSRNTCSVPPVE